MISRVVLPRESGVYAELLFPLLTAFMAGGASWPGVAFAVAVTAGILVREPLAVLNGVRGARLEQTHRPPARRAAGIFGALGVGAAVTAVWLAPPRAAQAAILPGMAAAVLAPAVLRGRPKTLGGELLVAVALATTVLPIGLAGVMPLPAAVAAATVWAVSFALATLAVHAIKARHKPGTGVTWAVWVAPAAATLVAIGGLLGTATADLPTLAGVAVLPPALVVLATTMLRIHPRSLRRVGWSVVAANAVTLAVLLWA